MKPVIEFSIIHRLNSVTLLKRFLWGLVNVTVLYKPMWSRVLENEIITQLVRKLPFMELEGVHKSPPLAPILSQPNPFHTFPPCFPKIHSSIPSLHVGLPSHLSSSGFLTKILYAFLISPMCATCCLTHLILINLIILTVFGEVCKL